MTPLRAIEHAVRLVSSLTGCTFPSAQKANNYLYRGATQHYRLIYLLSTSQSTIELRVNLINTSLQQQKLSFKKLYLIIKRVWLVLELELHG